MLAGVDPAHITEVFQETLVADGPSYVVSVVVGDPAPLVEAAGGAGGVRGLRRRSALKQQHKQQPPQQQPFAPRDKAGTATVPDFRSATLGPLFEHGAGMRAAACPIPLEEQVRLPIRFYVRGPKLTITSAEGLRIIKAFSALRFASLLGADAAAAVCGATLQSVSQVMTTNPPTAHAPAEPLEQDEAPAAPEPPAAVAASPAPITPAAASDASRPAAAQAAASPNAVGEEGEREGHEGKAQVSAATRAALITAGVVGTIVILFGAVKYALALRPEGGAGGGALVVYADSGHRAYLHP